MTQLKRISQDCCDHGKVGNRRGYASAWYHGVCMNMHRAIYIEAYGYIPDGCVIMHLCDNPRCINLNHLVANTSSANRKDCVKKGRHFSRRVLSDEEKIICLQQLADGNSQRKVAEWHGVHQATIWRLKRHVENAGGTGIFIE